MTHPESGVAPGDVAAVSGYPRHMIFFIGALVAIGPLSLDAYLPAMPAMAETFGVGIVRINNTISLYLIGYGVGQFFERLHVGKICSESVDAKQSRN